MNQKQFQSYSGDTYERWEDHRGRCRCRRIKKAHLPGWEPPSRVTKEEEVFQLRAEVKQLEVEIGYLQRRISVIGNTGSPCACSWEPGADGELRIVKWCAFHAKAASDRALAEAVRG